jgi:hypothetical protein
VETNWKKEHVSPLETRSVSEAWKISVRCLSRFLFAEANTSLESLNLSWNHIRNSASVALFRGLEVKESRVMLFSRR